MPRYFCLEKLVVLDLSRSSLVNVWRGRMRRRLLQSDGIVANAPNIAALRLKLSFCSWFSTRKISRFSTFSLPCSLVELNLHGTPIRSLPESIKGLSTLKYRFLRKSQMLQTLPELPSNLLWIDVSSCYSLQRVTNLIGVVIQEDCDHLVQFQDLIKLELIQKSDLHMSRIMETVILQIQPSTFEVLPHPFIALQLSNLVITCFATSEFSFMLAVDVEMKNNTKGKSMVFSPNSLKRSYEEVRMLSLIMVMK
ncbi:unnamed protein product [Dovyalis caffra]|uniref:Uncharacterized protein n=1 Tax=Dovyalis caffra TaxID=77055 RepID=A0AAV1SL84_9ROSI|nr:unnamed protein product [Dovyalis caffra]